MRFRFLTILAFPILVGCSSAHGQDDAHKDMWSGITDAVCVVAPTQGNRCSGVVRFSEKDGQVTVTATLSGLTANQEHAIHIHQFGDCTDLAGKSAGGHYNPKGLPHSLPPDPKRHAGDLGNLRADASGKATLTLVVKNITIAGLRNPIIGRGIVVHAKRDDGGQPTGNAGARIGCGVIGIAKSAK